MQMIQEIIDKLRKVDPLTGFPESILLGFSDVSSQSEHLARYMFAANYATGVVLDLAAGTGFGSSILARENSNYVIAADINHLALTYGKQVYGRRSIDWVHCDANCLPFRADSFDLIVTMETLEHVGLTDSVIHEFGRTLRLPGKLFISTPNKIVTTPIFPCPMNPYHSKEYSLKTISEMLEKQDLRIRRVFLQSRISLARFFLRIMGVLFAYISVTLGISIVPLRNALKNFPSRQENELFDPNPELFSIYAYNSIFEVLSSFTLMIMAERES